MFRFPIIGALVNVQPLVLHFRRVPGATPRLAVFATRKPQAVRFWKVTSEIPEVLIYATTCVALGVHKEKLKGSVRKRF